jgi:transcriptional regulator with XRE-family HTH domain
MPFGARGKPGYNKPTMQTTNWQTILPETLAQRVQFFRVMKGLTPRQLAQKAHLPLDTIEQVEAGIDVVVSTLVRMRLARGLGISSEWLKTADTEAMLQAIEANQDSYQLWMAQKSLIEAVLKAPGQTHLCPQCQSQQQTTPVVVTVFLRHSLEGVPIQTYKIRCSQCLFAINHEVEATT